MQLKNKFLFMMGIIVAAIIVCSALFFVLKIFDVEDSCGLVFGKPSHSVDSADICKSRCQALCVARDYQLLYSSFSKKADACNSCRCYCR